MLTWMKRSATLKASPPYQIECPSCPSCGCATVRSRQDMTFEVGNKEVRSEPLVHATIIMNVPVFKCTNPSCAGGLYGIEAQEIISPITEVLTRYARPQK